MRIGIDLGGTKMEGIILADDGSVTEKIRVNTPGDDYTDIVTTLASLVNDLQNKSKSALSVGIGTPGALSYPEEVMKNCNSICLNGTPLQRDIESKLGYKVRLENDANCFALSEANYGAAKNSKTMFGVIIGTGTGGGIVINRQLLTGPNSIAGEWGHNPIPSSVSELVASNRQCYCGRSNCIETVLSGRGLKQTYEDISGDSAEAIQIAELAESGDPKAQRCLDIYCQQLARCLATIVNVIDPEMIVLGGGVSNIKQLYNRVPELMKEFVFTDKLLTLLSPPSFGDASGARGAACLWSLEELAKS